MDSVGAGLDDWLSQMPTADPSVEALRQRIGRLMRLFDRLLADVAETEGISRGDLAALSALVRADRPCTPTELRQTLGLTSGTVSTRLARLADAGLIAVLNGPDGRSRPVQVTASGRKRWAAATTARVDRERELVHRALDGAQLDTANQLLAVLLESAEQELGEATRHDTAP